jgi:hypothetical protein
MMTVIYKSVILPVVLCVSETWSLSVRIEHLVRMSENRVLRGNIWNQDGGRNRRLEKSV